MVKIPDNVTILFNEEGESFTDVLEQILKILTNSERDGDVECKRKL